MASTNLDIVDVAWLEQRLFPSTLHNSTVEEALRWALMDATSLWIAPPDEYPHSYHLEPAAIRLRTNDILTAIKLDRAVSATLQWQGQQYRFHSLQAVFDWSDNFGDNGLYAWQEFVYLPA